jgi:acyl carrier protein
VSDVAFDSGFLTVFEDILGWDLELTDDDGPGTVETWNSLAQVRLVHALESRFDIRLPDSALLEEQTVGSLRRLVRERVAAS